MVQCRLRARPSIAIHGFSKFFIRIDQRVQHFFLLTCRIWNFTCWIEQNLFLFLHIFQKPRVKRDATSVAKLVSLFFPRKSFLLCHTIKQDISLLTSIKVATVYKIKFCFVTMLFSPTVLGLKSTNCFL